MPQKQQAQLHWLCRRQQQRSISKQTTTIVAACRLVQRATSPEKRWRSVRIRPVACSDSMVLLLLQWLNNTRTPDAHTTVC